MKHYRKESRYVSVLTVHVPSAMALVDMLRYDRCCPADEDQSRKIWRLIGERCGDDHATPMDHVITLHRFATSTLPATDRRWQSFQCTVLDERSPDDPPLTDAEVANLVKVKVRT